ncbi:glycosyltransferase family 4 protein [Tropicimonas sp. S265A]|uniref:glycosyltransferase family 4 protein n=1 Tax=Tropicimonas sp. S265A TaxID=3415134 RepID=UPI003C7B952D
MSDDLPLSDLAVLAPNLKRRLSGVTSTIVRLVPIQADQIGIRATGPGLPADVPQFPLARCFSLPRDRWRVWHARRNTEMALGLILRRVFRRKFKLLFTSAAQRHHTGFTKHLIGQMDAVIATTSKAASYLDRPATVIMHGVDTQVFQPAEDRTVLKSRLGLGEGPLIGCFGRIRHQKGTDVLIDALCEVLPEIPQAQAVILGRALPKEQDFLDALKTQVSEAGLSDRIHFKGEVPWDQVVAHYKALDLYIAPQRWEGFGLTPLEAMACGVPVLATPVGAFDEIIMPGQTGDILPIADVSALESAMREWLGDPDALSAARPRCRAHVTENYAIEGEAARIIAVYRELLATP